MFLSIVDEKGTRFKSYRMKVLGAFIISVIIPVVVIAVIMIHIFIRNYKSQILSDARHNAEEIVSVLDGRMQQVQNAADSIQSSVLALITDNGNNISVADYYERFANNKRQIMSICSAFDFLHISIFIDSAHPISKENLYFFSLDQYMDSEYYLQSDIKKSGATEKWGIFNGLSIPKLISYNLDLGKPVACYYQVVMNAYKKAIDYAYYITINPAEFENVIQGHLYDLPFEYQLVDTEGASLLLSDSVQSDRGQLPVNEFMTVHDGIYEKDHTSYIISPFENASWFFILSVPDSYLFSKIFELIYPVIIVLIVIMVFSFIEVHMNSKRLSKKVTNAITVMREYKMRDENYYSFQIPYDNKDPDELDYLLENFNILIEKINGMHNDILQLSMHREKLRYELLQSKINPHFLYNILDSVHACIASGDSETASLMILNLSRFYRFILTKTDEMIPIAEELEICRLYLELEQMCMKDRLFWEIDMDPDIGNFRICRFCLQPIIENCIVHGTRNKGESLHIRISIRFLEDSIQLVVEDDGRGIEREKVFALREAMAMNLNDTANYYGICNVSLRIKQCFPSAIISIDSKLGEGTRIGIIISPEISDNEV